METAITTSSKQARMRNTLIPVSLFGLWFAGAAVLVTPNILPFLRGPVHRSETYDVYLSSDGSLTHRYAYLVNLSCDASHRAGRFYLHSYPTNPDNLQRIFRERGFHNSDFTFPDFGWHKFGICWIEIALPSFPVTFLRFGQYIPDASGNFVHLWGGESSVTTE